MFDSNQSETVFLRAPRIFAAALYRTYGDFSRSRPYIKPNQHWMAVHPDAEDERLVIHGQLDREQTNIKQAIVRLDVGIIATKDMVATWLKIPKPQEFLQWDQTTTQKLRHYQMEDEVIAYMSERYAQIRPDTGQLISDTAALLRIAQYSERLTTLGRSGSFWEEPRQRNQLSLEGPTEQSL